MFANGNIYFFIKIGKNYSTYETEKNNHRLYK